MVNPPSTPSSTPSCTSPSSATNGASRPMRGRTHRQGNRRANWRALAIVLGVSFAGLVAGVLVFASVSVAAGALLVAGVLGIQKHALAAPALAPPPAGLNLEPIAANGVLPDTMPGARPLAPTESSVETIAADRRQSFLPVVAASPDPLAGPRLSADVYATLVRRDIEGKLAAPAPNPAEAALRLVSLDEGSRRAINAALNIRGRHLDHAVIINLPFFIVAQSAQGGGNKALVAGVAAIALARSREFLAIDDLESLIASQLPAPQRSQYRALLQDYWHQFALDAARERVAKGQDPAPESLLIVEAKLKLVGEEAARSFERTLRSGDLFHYWFSRHIGLSPNQAGRFRATLAEYAQEYAGDGDRAAKRKLLEDLREGLNTTQQRTLERNMQGFLD
jgi:hypothetical protein